jgi:predicted nucleic acid-binding protein
MKPVVLDASTALATLLHDERSPYATRVLEVMETGPHIFVPSHWWIESLNGILMAERRGRFSPLETAEIVGDLLQLPVTTDDETISRAADETFHLARQYKLTVYDAVYLELAMRRQAILATVDKALAKAAGVAGVELLV